MFARTSRLFLRPAWAEDAPELADLLNDAEISSKLTSLPYPYTLADAEAFISSPQSAQTPTCLIFKRGAAAELIGGIGLMRTGGRTELGYWLARPYWGNGCATEAGEAMLRTARAALGCQEVFAQHALDNPASARVLRKLGFRPTGRVTQTHSLARRDDMPCAEYVIQLEPVASRVEHPSIAA